MRKKRVAFWVSVLGLIGIGIFLPARLQTRPLLFQNAVRVATAPSKHRLNGAYRWIAPHEVLLVLNDFENIGVVRYRTDTKQTVFLHRNNAVTKDAFAWSFSPDGRWYLCMQMRDVGFAYYLCAADDSRRYKVYSETSDGTPEEPYAWLGNSKKWLIRPTTSDLVEVRNLNDTSGSKHIFPAVLEKCSLLLDAGTGHSIISRWFGDKQIATVAVGFWDTNAPDQSVKQQIPLPMPARVIDVAIAPKGDRLAWLLHVHEEDRIMVLLSRVLRSIPRPRQQDTYQVWTTDLDGSSPHLIGVKEIKLVWEEATTCFPAGWQHSGGVYNLGWTPDARKVSFTFEDGLYTVDAR